MARDFGDRLVNVGMVGVMVIGATVLVLGMCTIGLLFALSVKYLWLALIGRMAL